MNIEPVFELEVWSRPGFLYDCDYGKQGLEKQITRDLFLSKGVALGVSQIPDSSDVTNLAMSLEDGELLLSDFNRFCYGNKLRPDPTNELSACKFLEHSYGRALMWIHIADNDSAENMIRKISDWSKRNEFCLIDPDKLFCFIY